MARKPLPPQRGKTTNARGHKPHIHARLVNLDTGTHVDPHGVEHKTSPADPAIVGPLTIVLASNMGHDAMPYAEHDKLKSSAHAHMKKRAVHPHPNEIAGKLATAMVREEGSPDEEAAETPREEAAEKRAGTEKPTKKRLPLPPRREAA